jgi:hypothetical protein
MYLEGKGKEKQQYYEIFSEPSGYSSESAAHDEGPGKSFVPDLQAALETVKRKQTEAEVIQGTHCCLCRKPLAGDEKSITAHGTIFYGSLCRHTLRFRCYAGWFAKLHKDHWREGVERDFNLRDKTYVRMRTAKASWITLPHVPESLAKRFPNASNADRASTLWKTYG